MKKNNKYLPALRRIAGLSLLTFFSIQLTAQDVVTDSTQPGPVAKRKAIKNTFESNWIQDNQTVMVPIKGTFEMDIQHRFGVVKNGYKDLFGIYAPSNIRIGFSYVIKNKLQLGMGFTKDRLQWDVNGKYAIIKQDKTGGWPVSISWFGNIVIDTRPKENFVNSGDRLSYFNQLLIARKLTDKFSVQVAPSLSHYNNIDGYTDANGKIQPKMKNDHFAVALMGRYKMTQKTNLMVNYDQPITQHPMDNPHPNISFGLEMITSSHAFQVFFSNYHNITPQSNNFFNQNDYTKGQFLIGFNITRLWNF
ncbi:MAG: DUF5777 family beta-barrel protein [Ferruginibacter sp.]